MTSSAVCAGAGPNYQRGFMRALSKDSNMLSKDSVTHLVQESAPDVGPISAIHFVLPLSDPLEQLTFG